MIAYPFLLTVTAANDVNHNQKLLTKAHWTDRETLQMR